MKRKYLFDTEIAPLTEEEKLIMKNFEKFSSERNKILERTDKKIREHNKPERKKERLEEKALYMKKQKELVNQKELEKQKLKEENFPVNYNKFKKELNDIINSINFYNNKEKISEINKHRIDFREHCIHPLDFKCDSKYTESNESGYGMCTYATYRCFGCLLCKENYVSSHNYPNLKKYGSELCDNELLDKLKNIEICK